jgi:hypothetical protein
MKKLQNKVRRKKLSQWTNLITLAVNAFVLQFRWIRKQSPQTLKSRLIFHGSRLSMEFHNTLVSPDGTFPSSARDGDENSTDIRVFDARGDISLTCWPTSGKGMPPSFPDRPDPESVLHRNHWESSSGSSLLSPSIIPRKQKDRMAANSARRLPERRTQEWKEVTASGWRAQVPVLCWPKENYRDTRRHKSWPGVWGPNAETGEGDGAVLHDHRNSESRDTQQQSIQELLGIAIGANHSSLIVFVLKSMWDIA